MSRQSIYIILLCLISSYYSYAQKQYNVLSWKGDASLNTYLLQQLHQQYAVRSAKFNKALSSKKAMLAYRDSCRKRYLKILGAMPKAGNFNTQNTGTIQQDGYRIEKLVFESFANHHLTANLYMPSGKGTFPTILFLCGHEAEAKATESYQKTAILFAQHGFVVLIADPISQGERYQLTDNKGQPLTRGGTTEHTLLNAGANLVGTNVPAYELWDNVRSLDYLLTRPEVYKNQIGCIGNSGGATQTAYMMAHDQRIKVAALCSYVLNSETSLQQTGASDGCVNIPNENRDQLEDADYFTMFAPKPTLILAGKYDFINYNRVKDVYQETKQIYKLLNQPDNISLFTYDDGHGISKPKREAAVKWFRKWFYHDANPITEGDIKVLTATDLRCTPTGNINTIFKNEATIAGQNLALAEQFEAHRNLLTARLIKQVTGITINNAPVKAEWLSEISKEDYTIKKLILRRDAEVPLPCLVVSPNKAITGKITLWFPAEGKNKLANSVELIQEQTKQGNLLIIADLRGLGETADPLQYNDPKYFNSEYRNAALSLLTGKSLTAQRTQDIFTLLDFIKQDEKLNKLTIEVAASGPAAHAALYAASMNKTITKLNLYRTITSYKYMLQNPEMKDQYSYVIPDVLRYYDIADLVKMIGINSVKFW